MANTKILTTTPAEVESDYETKMPHRVSVDEYGSFDVERLGVDKLGTECWISVNSNDLNAKAVTRAAVKVLLEHWLKTKPSSS